MGIDSHILISQTLLPNKEVLDMDIPSISSPNLNITDEKREIAMYASIEWTIPSLVFIFLTQSYFEGFLGEASADHYKALKAWILRQNKRFKGIETMMVTASKSTQKVRSKGKSPNNFFSFYFTTPKGNRMKIFMPECSSDKKDEKVLSLLLEDLLKLYKKPKCKFSKKINSLTDKPYDELYAIFNKELEIWEFYTLAMLMRKSRLENHTES